MMAEKTRSFAGQWKLRIFSPYHRKAAELLDEMVELGVRCPVDLRKRYLSLRTQIKMLDEQHDHITGRKYPA